MFTNVRVILCKELLGQVLLNRHEYFNMSPLNAKLKAIKLSVSISKVTKQLIIYYLFISLDYKYY